MFEVRFSICPEDCWACEVSQRFPEVAMEVLSFNEHVGLGKWSCRDKSRIDDAFVFAKAHQYVSSLEPVHVSERTWVTKAICQCPVESRVHRLLPRFGCFYLFPKPIWFTRGRKHYRIVASDHNQLIKLMDVMEERFEDVKVTFKSPIRNHETFYASPVGRILARLSPQQRGALQRAYTNQYYKYPRKSTLEQLAQDMKIGKSTFQSHLRKAENKIIDSIMKV